MTENKALNNAGAQVKRRVEDNRASEIDWIAKYDINKYKIYRVWPFFGIKQDQTKTSKATNK